MTVHRELHKRRHRGKERKERTYFSMASFQGQETVKVASLRGIPLALEMSLYDANWFFLA